LLRAKHAQNPQFYNIAIVHQDGLSKNGVYPIMVIYTEKNCDDKPWDFQTRWLSSSHSFPPWLILGIPTVPEVHWVQMVQAAKDMGKTPADV
jgi:hypothetical protein